MNPKSTKTNECLSSFRRCGELVEPDGAKAHGQCFCGFTNTPYQFHFLFSFFYSLARNIIHFFTSTTICAKFFTYHYGKVCNFSCNFVFTTTSYDVSHTLMKSHYTTADTTPYHYVPLHKQYELSNHLGNVLVTLSAKPILVDSTQNNIVDYKMADVMSVSDYYPFGMMMPERHWSSEKYRFGFNGMENINEVYGTGNYVDFPYRCYNPRIGRFMSPDPLIVYGQQYPELSSYQFASNQPIWAIDLEGLQRLVVTTPVLFGQDQTTIRTEAASTVERRTAEAGVAMRHPQAASRVGSFKSGSTNISSVSSRMARHIASGGNMTTGEGSERNALRHGLWQAMIANEFDAGIARRIGNAHEGIKLAQSGHVDFNLPLVQDLQAADDVVDFLNNEIGRSIAAGFGKGATTLDIAKGVLKVQRDEGLWTVNQGEDGAFSISRTKITQEQYKAGIETLNTLDKHGFNEAERKELQRD